MEISSLVRPNILRLQPYSSARDEYTGAASVYLDANESPYDSGVNRYPDPLQRAVKAEVARLKGIAPEQIFLGNGSDEAIDLVYRVFCRPGVDNVVAPAPTYGMYQVCAEVNDVAYRAVPLGDGYRLDAEAMRRTADDRTKVVWLCSPNNPTGNRLTRTDVEAVMAWAPGLVVIDEAYIDFAAEPSFLKDLARWPRLIVLQTFSKAWGLAGVRLGMAFASVEIIRLFNRVKYPYNVNQLTQQRAMEALAHADLTAAHVAETLRERARMAAALPSLPCVREVYPSEANFLLVRVADADAAYGRLVADGIIVRNRTRVTLCAGCLRITIGTPAENDTLLAALATLPEGEKEGRGGL